MWWSSAAVFFALCCFSAGSDLFGAKHKPTKGAVWPKPKLQVTKDAFYKYDQIHFNVTIVGHSCTILDKAIERYTFAVRDAHRNAVRWAREERKRSSVEDVNYRGYLEQLQVDLTAPCETYPHFGMDESYNLTVGAVSRLSSGSVWGALRALESWVQLFYFTDDEPDLRINETSIMDGPAYPHRGLLLDTSRHYVSLSKILITLDAMAMNKLNVLHWHIVDDQSFPYQSEKFPELSKRGAYHSSMVYSKQDIQKVISYAKDRGIRVLPEFDVPGHTRSWGESHPELLTTCYKNSVPSGLGPMNPIRNGTYELLRELFTEVQEWFPETYLHVGGDEVDLSCWNSNPELIKYMQSHNMTAEQLHGLFMSNVIPLLGRKSKPIVWQEVFDESVPLPDNTLVQVWKTNYFDYIIKAGYKVIFSSAWYLDHLSTGGDWERLYQVELQLLSDNSDNVVGGEACMWGEVVDDTNVISRVWPRASAVAEKLWSPPTGSIRSSYVVSEEVYSRIEEHTCRMMRRGVAAQPPSGPGFCLGAVN